MNSYASVTVDTPKGWGSKCQYKFLTSLILNTGRINYTMATYEHACPTESRTKQAERGPRGKQEWTFLYIWSFMLSLLCSEWKNIHTQGRSLTQPASKERQQRSYKPQCETDAAEGHWNEMNSVWHHIQRVKKKENWLALLLKDYSGVLLLNAAWRSPPCG